MVLLTKGLGSINFLSFNKEKPSHIVIYFINPGNNANQSLTLTIMSTTFNNTVSVPEFAQTNGIKAIEVRNSSTGKPFMVSDNGIELKCSSEAADKFIAKDFASLRVSECSDEAKNFFMMHLKKDDSTVVATVTF